MYIYILLILFFTSLIAIVVMIGRKLVLLKNGHISIVEEEILLGLPHLKELRRITVIGIQKYGHLALVTSLRLYIQFSNFLKNKYRQVLTEIKNRSKINHINGEKKEISKFLKIIGDYKHKIKEIKHKIHEEEKSL